MGVADIVAALFDGKPPFKVTAYDGSVAGPDDAPLTVRFNSEDAVRRIITRPGELGMARAYVAGDIDLDGELDGLFSLQSPSPVALVRSGTMAQLLRNIGISGLKPVEPPAIEARPHGALHSRERDREAVTHHYDVSNYFYSLVLGPSMVYSCAVFSTADEALETAQLRKVDLIARKLNLAPGQRLLDVGCGWGTMAIHAAKTYGCHAVGITLSEPQRARAQERAEAAGVSRLVEFRVQDYRDVTDGPFDAISSIGMSEHVGRRSLEAYIASLYRVLKPGGRLLNHAIGRPATREENPKPTRAGEAIRQIQIATGMRGPSRVKSEFMDRYVFPDGELHEVGTMVSMFQAHGLEVRHLESLREHYALTLRAWVRNLEDNFEAACNEVGRERARVWRLYMAGSAVGFERHQLEIHQILMVKPMAGRAPLALREAYEPDQLVSWFA
jgi:cyclopropane-fatty-acyl-phospholipid synthase